MRTILFLIPLFLLLNCEQSSSKQQNSVVAEKTKTAESPTDHSWRRLGSYTHQTDTTFQIELWQKDHEQRLELSFSKAGRFTNEIQKTAGVLCQMAAKTDFSQINEVIIFPINNEELFNDFLSLKAIQENISINEKKGHKWINFAVVEASIGQSKLLNNFTDIFSIYGLEPTSYHIEKCVYHPTKNQTYTMTCPRLEINLAPIK
ncbi:MAG: hypothetical protein AAGJ93_01405 [Bacteroidota bacterium]